MVVDKERKKAVVIDKTVPSDSNIKKREFEQIEHRGLKEELERM